jgi:glycosyltransferase involved in cell wall biosynthesis
MAASRHITVAAKAGAFVDHPLVTVIVPAYNAARTIEETLLSVRAQSYERLEILVVDDGSRDATAAIVQAHAASDRRVQLVSQGNAGVAAARNAGLGRAQGAYVAFVDADDVWRADKIALQLAAFDAAGPEVGLVYSWHALIDDNSRVIQALPRPSIGEDLLEALARTNIVGNGSSALVRRELAVSIGFDEGLRRARAEGCEDRKFYFAVAERASFALVPDFLVGYRESPDNMSSDVLQMLRSRDLCMAEIQERHPRLAPVLRRSRAIAMSFMLYRAARHAHWRSFAILLVELCRYDPLRAVDALARLGVRHARALLRGPQSRALTRYSLLAKPSGLEP